MIEIPRHLLESKEPFLVCSRSVLKQQLERLESLGLEVLYSVKTNPEPQILEELHKMGAGFSVPGIKEFLLLTSMGVEPKRMFHHERVLTGQKADALIRSGCRNFTVENRTSFDILAEKADGDFTILIRVKGSGIESGYSGRYSPGFGPGEVGKLIEICKKKGVIAGVLHHSASQIEDPAAWREKFRELSDLPKTEIVDIGGGMPIDYGREVQDKVLDAIGGGLKALEAQRILAEPGRFIVGPACSLVTRVEAIDGENAMLNASVYNTHIDTIIAGIALPCRALKNGAGRAYRLLGSSLCNLDVFNQKVKLPKLYPGDVVVFDKAGAYNSSSDFGSDSGVRTYIVD